MWHVPVKEICKFEGILPEMGLNVRDLVVPYVWILESEGYGFHLHVVLELGINVLCKPSY